jgi:hypothetical protein
MIDYEDNKQQAIHKEKETATMPQTHNAPTTPHKAGETPRDQKKTLENTPMKQSTVENMDDQILTEGTEDDPMQQESSGQRDERTQSPKRIKKFKTEKTADTQSERARSSTVAVSENSVFCVVSKS